MLGDRGAWRARQVRLAEFRDQAAGRPVYICFDMDVFDPSCAPGVCSPSWGGLSAREGIDLIRTLTDLNIVAVDVATVSPPQDVNNMAAHLCDQGNDRRSALPDGRVSVIKSESTPMATSVVTSRGTPPR